VGKEKLEKIKEPKICFLKKGEKERYGVLILSLFLKN
jgi:hypothetical protein